MTDWADLLNSDDYRAYRKKQMEAVADIISHAVNQLAAGNPTKIEQLEGQLDVVGTLLRLPETLTGDEGILQNLGLQYQEDIASVTKHLLKTYSREDDK